MLLDAFTTVWKINKTLGWLQALTCTVNFARGTVVLFETVEKNKNAPSSASSKQTQN